LQKATVYKEPLCTTSATCHYKSTIYDSTKIIFENVLVSLRCNAMRSTSLSAARHPRIEQNKCSPLQTTHHLQLHPLFLLEISCSSIFFRILEAAVPPLPFFRGSSRILLSLNHLIVTSLFGAPAWHAETRLPLISTSQVLHQPSLQLYLIGTLALRAISCKLCPAVTPSETFVPPGPTQVIVRVSAGLESPAFWREPSESSFPKFALIPSKNPIRTGNRDR